MNQFGGGGGGGPSTPVYAVISPATTESTLAGSPTAVKHEDGSVTGSEPAKKKQKRNKPTLSCEECVERKTKVSDISNAWTRIALLHATQRRPSPYRNLRALDGYGHHHMMSLYEHIGFLDAFGVGGFV